MKIKFLVILCCLSSGCVANRNFPKVVQALAKDPATVHVRISSVYGVVEFSRTNPQTNSLPHTVSPDGTISVNQPK